MLMRSCANAWASFLNVGSRSSSLVTGQCSDFHQMVPNVGYPHSDYNINWCPTFGYPQHRMEMQMLEGFGLVLEPEPALSILSHQVGASSLRHRA